MIVNRRSKGSKSTSLVRSIARREGGERDGKLEIDSDQRGDRGRWRVRERGLGLCCRQFDIEGAREGQKEGESQRRHDLREGEGGVAI